MHKSGFRTLIYISLSVSGKEDKFEVHLLLRQVISRESPLAQEMYYRTEAYLLSLDNLSCLSGLPILTSLMYFLLSHPLLVLLDSSPDQPPQRPLPHEQKPPQRKPGEYLDGFRSKNTSHDVFVLLNQKLHSGCNWLLSLAPVVAWIAQFNYFFLLYEGCMQEFCCLPLLQRLSGFQ